MACLTIAQDAIDGAKVVASSAKGAYTSSLGSLRAVNPGSFSNRVDFEAAKSAAIGSTIGALSGYISGISAINSAASALSSISGLDLDNIAALDEASALAIVALIPGGPAVPGAISAAKLAKEVLQC
jgi:hypothetical protein